MFSLMTIAVCAAMLACTPAPDNGSGGEDTPQNPLDEQIQNTTVEVYKYAPEAPRTPYYVVNVQGKDEPQNCYVFPIGSSEIFLAI